MPRPLEVAKAVKALVATALPAADVIGMDLDAAKPGELGPGGRAEVSFGTPGDPEQDLSPLSYNYNHQVPVELSAFPTSPDDAIVALDEMLVAIGAAIVANRTLGGLCHWVDAFAPDLDGLTAPNGGEIAGTTVLVIVASYTSSTPA